MKRFISAFGVAVLLISANASRATLVTWTGAGGTPNWSNASNWDIGVPNATNDIDLTDITPRSTSVCNNVMATPTSLGLLTIGNAMTLQVDKAGLTFSSFSIVGNWVHSGSQNIGYTSTGPMSLDAASATTTISSGRTCTVASLVIDADSANASRAFTKDGAGLLVVDTSGSTMLTADDDSGNFPATFTLSAGTFTPGSLYLNGGDTSSRKAGFYYNSGTLSNPVLMQLRSYVEFFCNSANVDVPVVGNLTVDTNGSRDTHAEIKMASGKELQPAGFVIQGAASTYSAECTVTGGAIVTQGP